MSLYGLSPYWNNLVKNLKQKLKTQMFVLN